jgi:hypothetical protein
MHLNGLILFIIISGLLGCQSSTEEKGLGVFKPPKILTSQFSDSLTSIPYEAESVTEVFPNVIGKFKLQDEIDINPDKRDASDYKDFYYRDFRRHENDSLAISGLELAVDYSTTVKYNGGVLSDSILYDHYPVYFINSTTTDKVLYGKDSYLFGIQEALDQARYRQWWPIEGRGFDFCGNGHWELVVHPQEFVLALMKKYAGDCETDMRVRFAIGDYIIVSRPFKGIMNESQFSIEEDSYVGFNLRDSDAKALSWLFYGAVPKEDEWSP